ncbi:DUF72 domain-containing protein [Nocardia sp. NPDC057227]|uniref:DUF72 domain-containing protein n=1 Tax=Nocardia sp. NPDC057227 TaxID=3346056 RepID=UPI00364380BA
MRLHVGCAMWSHGSWFERQPPAAERLRRYAEHCTAVEGNTTFYATPARRTAESWAAQLTPDFRFYAKLPRPVTHEHRLGGGEAELAAFLDAMEPLGPSLHALWVQLPPTFGPNDLGALAAFLPALPAGPGIAVEVRHPAFFEDVEQARRLVRVLNVAGAEWVTFDTTTLYAAPPRTPAEHEAWGKKPRLPRRTPALGPHPVVRYHGRDDAEATAAGWAPWLETVAGWLHEGRSPTVFVHTPDNGDALGLARRFHAEVRDLVPELEPLPEPEPTEAPTLF